MERLIQDIRYGIRRLLKKPVFTLVAILSLAIGIGANTAIFTVVNAVIFRDLPYQNPQELVEIYRSVAGFSHGPFSQPDLVDVRRDASDVFADVSGSRLAFVPTDVADGVEVLMAELVTGNYFQLLGLAPALGRSLLPEDDTSPGGHPVVMLSHSYWQTRYGGDPGVIGQTLRLNGLEYTIVGVTHEEFAGSLMGIQSAFFAPSMMMNEIQPSDYDQLQARGNQSTFAKARLLPGVTLAEAQARMNRMAEDFKAQYPGNWQADNEITLVATSEVIMNPMIDKFIGPAAIMLTTVVGLVLLIACANLASFLLAQAADRRKEVALRLALGAQRGRLIQQLLTESVLLAALGGAAGIFLATQALTALVNADLPLPFPISLDLGLDGSVLGFSVAVTLGAGLFFGLAPALQATNPNVATTLKDETTGGGRPRRITLRNTLVVTQVAVCFVLLISAGLFLRSLQARTAVDPGFGYDPAAIVTLQTPTAKYSPEESEVFFKTLLAEIQAMPGVLAVGRTDDLHLSTMNNSSTGIAVDGIDPPPGQDYHLLSTASADAGLFEAAGIPIVAGRTFDERDNLDAAKVVVVSEAFSERFFPGQDAVGRTYRSEDGEVLIIGVARDAKVRGLGESPRPFIYRPFSQNPGSFATLVVSTTGDPQRLGLKVLALVRRMEPEMMVFEMKTMERHLALMLLPHRLSALIVGAFGILALLLASIGLYGVVSFSVATRTREVGIRMALGAEPEVVVRMLTGDGLKLVLVGALAGLGLAFAGARLMSGLLYGVEATDPLAFTLVPVVLTTVAALSAWLPARRAARVDPVTSLRSD